MDISSLTLLVEILDAGNLSAAARRLKMSRANVSYHLNQLERSVGAQLVRPGAPVTEPYAVAVQRIHQLVAALIVELTWFVVRTRGAYEQPHEQDRHAQQ